MGMAVDDLVNEKPLAARLCLWRGVIYSAVLLLCGTACSAVPTEPTGPIGAYVAGDVENKNG